MDVLLLLHITYVHASCVSIYRILPTSQKMQKIATLLLNINKSINVLTVEHPQIIPN